MNTLHRLLDLLSPRSCVVCDARLSPSEHTLCTACSLALPFTGHALAPHDNDMARLFYGRVSVCRCAALIDFHPHAHSARLIYQLKYGGRPDVGHYLGRLMAYQLRDSGFFDGISVLLPVPLTRRRRWQRGYNQSQLLAEGIGEVMHLPVATGVLQRHHFSLSQTQQSVAERQRNVERAFTATDVTPLQGRHVLLIDDICTTGATLTACCQALHHTPGIQLSVLTFGHTTH